MKYIVFSLLFFSPLSVSASFIINEIMYDLEGSDSSREWVEIHNTGSAAVDLSDWRFFEADTNHKLKISNGSAVIPPQGYAIIADNASIFLEEHPGFSGNVFDSSFSLKNTGELLVLRDGELNDIDSVTYTSDWGAKGDGNSLQFIGGSWTSAAPTPGKANSSGGSTLSPSSNDSDEDSISSTPESSFVPLKEREFITVYIGSDRTVTVGAAEFFEAEAYKENGDKHPYITYRWNFGNGDVREGKKVLHQYNYPGTYVVWTAGIAADKLSATSRITVVARPANLYISSVTPSYIVLQNDSGRELNLSLWSLRAGEDLFQFPQNTIIISGASVTFSNTSTGLYTAGVKDVTLLYPNGMIAHAYNPSVQYATAVSYTTPSRNVSVASPVEVVSQTNKQSSFSQEDQVASVQATLGENSNSLFLWILALFGVLASAIFAVFLNKKDFTESTEGSLSADDFKIIEDEEIL